MTWKSDFGGGSSSCGFFQDRGAEEDSIGRDRSVGVRPPAAALRLPVEAILASAAERDCGKSAAPRRLLRPDKKLDRSNFDKTAFGRPLARVSV